MSLSTFESFTFFAVQPAPRAEQVTESAEEQSQAHASASAFALAMTHTVAVTCSEILTFDGAHTATNLQSLSLKVHKNG